MTIGNTGRNIREGHYRWLIATVLCLIFFAVPARATENQIEGGNKNTENAATKNLGTDFSNESGLADMVHDKQNDDIWIEDDVKCSGLYRAKMSDKFASTLAELSETNKQQIKYTWYRMTLDNGATVPDSATMPGTAVTHRQTGGYNNIAASAQHATWIRLDADENGEIWRNDKDRYYYVTVPYPDPDNNGQTKTVISTPMKVNWYSQLENGDFEVPLILNNGASSDTGSRFRNQYSNAVYKAKKGVWQTTGEGSGENAGADIEVVNTTEYGWRSITPPENYGFDDSAKFKAASGDQFVKLNCKNAGALYQDIITHPNETLNYQFSHHARGSYNGGKGRTKHRREYDTMYLVIMPTQLAMTSGSNGTELASQGDLIDFINAHGGFSYNKASGIEDQVTYNNSSGILIRKVSSSNEAWHNISETNGYTAKGGLTRFFFVSGPTSWPEAGSRSAVLNATNGNLLDNVGFSQALSTPKDFDLTVQKTFSGMTPLAIEKMKTGENAYKLTVTNGNESKKLALSGTQPDGVILTETSNGSQKIFTWTIAEWGYDGRNYSVKEENIASPETNQRPSQIKINGDELTGADFTGATKSNIICAGDSTGYPDITVENRYDPNIKIKKTDEAAFKLYRINGNNSKEYFISKNENGIIIWGKAPNGKYFKAEGTDGMVDIGILPRATGSDGDTYYLEMVKASGDDSKSTQDIGFKVLSDGRVSEISDSSLMTVDDHHPYFLITVNNATGAVLPNTGGTGIALFIIIGLVIAICATAAIAKRRQQFAAQTDPHGTQNFKGDKK